ncbi:MAG: TonB-dependent receptor [Verrucomicrobiae bacterium]|nr:TonB-dependent receptor [Verrucomicrobiae bacterium]
MSQRRTSFPRPVRRAAQGAPSLSPTQASVAALTALIMAHGLAAQAQSAASTAPAGRLPDVVVTGSMIGSPEAVRDIPGSATYLGLGEIRDFNQTDINRVLRQVPGVYVREEDGYGNFPNISLRGVTTVRNSKITVMEDGILAAPAPYTDPAAYYTPAVGRMSGLEIIKGSSQIKYGPQITGGVVNYLSTPLPADRQTFLKAYYGSHNEVFGLGDFGDRIPAGNGNVSFLLEGFYHRSDGFKTIDAGPGVDRDKTGFERIEPMIKLAYDLNTEVYQRIEAKYGYTRFTADESYLGLAEADFGADPYRRYSSTRFDRIPTDHHRTYLRHLIRPSDRFEITTTGYYQHFERAWYKLNDVRAAGDTTWRSPAEVLAGAHGALDVLRGTQAGQLRYRNNNRDYTLHGVEQNYRYEFATGAVDHTLEGGIRYHYDRSSRFQNDTVYTVDAAGNITGTSVGTPGSQDNREGDSTAWAFHVQDRLAWDRWTITPGLRYEHIDFSRNNRNSGAQGEGDLDVMAGGVGIDFDVSDPLTLLAGVHRGFAVPGPEGALGNGLDEETSLSFETGARYHLPNGLRAEAIYFFTAFRDLIVDSNAGGGGGGITENAGDVDVHGVEFSLQYDPGAQYQWVVRTPMSLAFTYTDARFESDASSVGAGGASVESIFSGAVKGNRVPYIPEYQINARVGLEYSRYGLYLNATYIPETFATGSNTSLQARPDGTPDARFGKTDAHFLLDLTAEAQLTPWARAFFGVRNLTDKEYVASRIPLGPRPGMPQTFYGGLSVAF